MREQTIALSGMLQCGELVRQIATSGHCGQKAASSSVGSIFNMSPESTEGVYGGLDGVRMGLRMAVEVLGGKTSEDNLQSLNYALAMIKLSNQLRRDRKRQQKLGEEISLVASAWEKAGRDGLDESVISQLGDVYQRCISSMDFRITVRGKPEFLKQPEKVARIRSLLLAGIRSAMLWRQVGGRQWRLVFQRRRLLSQAQALLVA